MQRFVQIDSTNDEAKRQAKRLDPQKEHWDVFVADSQSRGKGQKERAWESKEGGLYYTFLFTPKTITAHDLETYSLKIGHVISESINRLTGLKTEVEWPNDIILDDKKCAGILIETVCRSGKSQPDFMIIGVGVNLNQESFGPIISPVAISLRQKTQNVYNRDLFIETFTEELKACR